MNLLEKAKQRIGQKVHGKGDAEAPLHGWVVRELDGGLRRSYRDPRFGQRRNQGAPERAEPADARL